MTYTSEYLASRVYLPGPTATGQLMIRSTIRALCKRMANNKRSCLKVPNPYHGRDK